MRNRGQKELYCQIHQLLKHTRFSTEAYPAIRHLVEKTVASGLIYVNSHAVDFKVRDSARTSIASSADQMGILQSSG